MLEFSMSSQWNFCFDLAMLSRHAQEVINFSLILIISYDSYLIDFINKDSEFVIYIYIVFICLRDTKNVLVTIKALLIHLYNLDLINRRLM